MLRRCAVVIRLHLRRCAAAPLRRCLVAVAPLRCCAAAPLFGCSCAGALLRRCGVVRFHLRRCAAAPLRRCVVAVAPVRCCAVAVSSGCSCAWFCACIPGCATGCYLRTVGLLGSDTCNCVFFTLALPVASIGGLMIFHNYYWLFIVWVLLDVDLNNVNCWNLHFFLAPRHAAHTPANGKLIRRFFSRCLPSLENLGQGLTPFWILEFWSCAIWKQVRPPLGCLAAAHLGRTTA